MYPEPTEEPAAGDTGRAPSTTVGTDRVKRGMAEMLKGGVIMDVVTPEQATIAEDAGAVAVMALERVPADIRAEGGVSRMSDPDMIDGIIDAVLMILTTLWLSPASSNTLHRTSLITLSYAFSISPLS